MKKIFDPKEDTCVFEIKSFIERDSQDANIDIVDAILLLSCAFSEIAELRSRLDIDFVYQSNGSMSEFPELKRVKTLDNKMLRSSDKISCLEAKIEYMAEVLYNRGAKNFVRDNFPEIFKRFNAKYNANVENFR